jgi:hypothetical protein
MICVKPCPVPKLSFEDPRCAAGRRRGLNAGALLMHGIDHHATEMLSERNDFHSKGIAAISRSAMARTLSLTPELSPPSFGNGV